MPAMNFNFISNDVKVLNLTENRKKKIHWNLPIASIPNSGHAINSGQRIKSQIWPLFLNYLPIADTSQ